VIYAVAQQRKQNIVLDRINAILYCVIGFFVEAVLKKNYIILSLGIKYCMQLPYQLWHW